MATTWNFTHKRGDTFKAREFQLSVATGVSTLANFPVEGTAGVIYKALDTGIFYEWDLTEYVVTTNKVYKSLVGVTILCQFRTKFDMPVAFTMKTTVVDAARGIFRFDEQVIDIPGRAYIYDVQFQYDSGFVETDIEGIATITEDVSRHT